MRLAMPVYSLIHSFPSHISISNVSETQCVFRLISNGLIAGEVCPSHYQTVSSLLNLWSGTEDLQAGIKAI
jgi:hypothetical protein